MVSNPDSPTVEQYYTVIELYIDLCDNISLCDVLDGFQMYNHAIMRAEKSIISPNAAERSIKYHLNLY